MRVMTADSEVQTVPGACPPMGNKYGVFREMDSSLGSENDGFSHAVTLQDQPLSIARYQSSNNLNAMTKFIFTYRDHIRIPTRNRNAAKETQF